MSGAAGDITGEVPVAEEQVAGVPVATRDSATQAAVSCALEDQFGDVPDLTQLGQGVCGPAELSPDVARMGHVQESKLADAGYQDQIEAELVAKLKTHGHPIKFNTLLSN